MKAVNPMTVEEAHTILNKAMEKYRECDAQARTADDNKKQALAELNRAQEQFDKAVFNVRAGSPPDSMWTNFPSFSAALFPKASKDNGK